MYNLDYLEGNLKTLIKNEQEQNKKLKEHAAQFVNQCRKLGIF